VILDGCGASACYLMLPIGQKMTQEELVSHIFKLHARSAARMNGAAK
jgi:hypothetical protein